MFAGSKKKDDDDEFIRMTSPRKHASLIQNHLLTVPGIQILKPEQRAQLENFIKRIESYQNHSILLIGPDIQVPKL